RVDRGLHLGPGADAPFDRDAASRSALLADRLADALELARHARVGSDDVVEGVGDLAADAGPVAGQTLAKIAVADRLKAAEELAQDERFAVVRVVVPMVVRRSTLLLGLHS